MRIAILVAAFCLMPFLCLAQPGQLAPPTGWRYPMGADYTDSWKAFRDVMPIPFHVEADFNSDSLPDHAWILFSTQDDAWGLFVFLAQEEAPPKIITLDKNPGTSRAQQMGIKLVPPGDYQTACGKGQTVCLKDEPASLHLELPAINYFAFEGASSFFWWDAQAEQFQRTWMDYGKQGPVKYRQGPARAPKSSKPYFNPHSLF